jgi:cell division protein FtsQ
MEHVLPAHRRIVRRGARLGPKLIAAAASLRKPSRLQVVLAIALAGLCAGGFLWFRTSSFVSVTEVQVSGVTGVDSGPIEAALNAAAKRQSTMAASAGALEAAVARFHVVRAIAVSTSFPHTMRIDVLEQLPVARLAGEVGTTVLAADGVVLGPALSSRALPQISASFIPKTGGTVHNWRLREYVKLLGATPAPLLPLVKQLYIAKQGLTAKMKGGLLVYFGNASRPHAKWASLAAVLANPEAKGAVYIDVRAPERPAAGMGTSAEVGSEAAEVSAGDPTSAELAESLASAVNGESPIEATGAISAPPAEATDSSTGLPAEEPVEETYPESETGAEYTSEGPTAEGSAEYTEDEAYTG